MKKERLIERGVGLYEAAMWLVALLPVSLIGTSVVALVHDQNYLSGVPAVVLRESPASGLLWVPDGKGGRFEIDVERLRVHAAQVAQRAVAEARQGIVSAESVSAKACFWIFSVDSSTGSLEMPIWSECDARGPLGRELSMSADLEQERSKARGISVGEGKGFVERVVLTGVVVAARTRRLLVPRSAYTFSKCAIAFARQEVFL